MASLTATSGNGPMANSLETCRSGIAAGASSGYQVQVDTEARAEIRALPHDALKDLAEARTVLQISSWTGDALRWDTLTGRSGHAPPQNHRRLMTDYLTAARLPPAA
jgi:hypothetical protein